MSAERKLKTLLLLLEKLLETVREFTGGSLRDSCTPRIIQHYEAKEEMLLVIKQHVASYLEGEHLTQGHIEAGHLIRPPRRSG